MKNGQNKIYLSSKPYSYEKKFVKKTLNELCLLREARMILSVFKNWK